MSFLLFNSWIHNQVTIQHEFQSSWRQSATPFCDLAETSQRVFRLPSGSLFAPDGLGADPLATPMSRFFQEFVDPKKAKWLKKKMKLRMQRFIEAVSFCISVSVHSHLATVLPCAEPLTALDPFQQRKASGPDKSVAFLVRTTRSETTHKLQRCQEEIHGNSIIFSPGCQLLKRGERLCQSEREANFRQFKFWELVSLSSRLMRNDTMDLLSMFWRQRLLLPITICSGISFWLPCIGLVPKEVELRQAFICGRRTATSERILQDFLSWCSRSLTRHPTNMQCQQKMVAGKKTTEDLEKVSISHQCPCPSVLLAILNLFQ